MPRIHWVARGTGTPTDRDHVNRRDVCGVFIIMHHESKTTDKRVCQCDG